MLVYSLGNFVSDQRTLGRDGGTMLRLTIKREADSTYLTNASYVLTWVNKHVSSGKRTYDVLPVRMTEALSYPELDDNASYRLRRFQRHATSFMDTNSGIHEYMADACPMTTFVPATDSWDYCIGDFDRTMVFEED